MPRLTIITGISGSGKSTYTKKIRTPDTLIINRDSLRESLTGQKASEYNIIPDPLIENVVTDLSHEIMAQAIITKVDVIVDNTNLRKRYIREFEELWDDEVEYVLIDCPPEIAKQRVELRDGHINTNYIDHQYQQLTELRKHLTFTKIIKEHEAI